jgi:hypothetical protein
MLLFYNLQVKALAEVDAQNFRKATLHKVALQSFPPGKFAWLHAAIVYASKTKRGPMLYCSILWLCVLLLCRLCATLVTVHSSFFFVNTACFGLTCHLQVYRLLWLRDLLLTVMLLCFSYVVASDYKLYTWRLPVRPKHVVSMKKNDEWIVTEVAHRRHKAKRNVR